MCCKILFILLSSIYSFIIIYNLYVYVNHQPLNDDLHTSITALHHVLHLDKVLNYHLALYITESERKIAVFKSFLKEFKRNNRKIKNRRFKRETKDVKLLLSTITKLTENFSFVQNKLNSKLENIITSFRYFITTFELPTENDLEGLILALIRIQETYNISSYEMANGIINGINLGKKLKTSECFQFAEKLREYELEYYAIEWYKTTLKRIEEEFQNDIKSEIDEILVLNRLAYVQYIEGSIEYAKDALETSLKAFHKDFNNPYTIELADNFTLYLKHYNELKSGMKDSISSYPPIGALSSNNISLLEIYKKGCRGELIKTSKEQRKLICKYETKNHPFLKYARLKMEIINFQPYIVIFHDIIYDSEIETLKNISFDKLSRANVWNVHKRMSQASSIRTSKILWLGNYTHSLVHTLNQRVSDMTGLTMETAEEFQLMNYGIGGHYEIHTDYFPEYNENNEYLPFAMNEWGNRIGTVLFYLSDVEYGGGTVWPFINVLTTPKKGSAAFWYNLFADGNGIFNSCHAACPTILGSKWVLNKWIRANGQIFRKPCYTYSDSLVQI